MHFCLFTRKTVNFLPQKKEQKLLIQFGKQYWSRYEQILTAARSVLNRAKTVLEMVVMGRQDYVMFRTNPRVETAFLGHTFHTEYIRGPCHTTAVNRI